MSIHTILSQMEEELDDLIRHHCVDLNDLDRPCADMNCDDGTFRDKLKSFNSSFATRIVEEVGKEMEDKIIEYQNGFVKQVSEDNYERAPEWQVIEDLLNHIHSKIK